MSQQPIPETCPASGTRSGRLLGFLFGLAPDGVFRASAITLGAVGFYPAFSPLPPASRWRFKFLWHCPSKDFNLSPACIPASRTGLRGIAPYGVRTFLPHPASGTEAILRPSKINAKVSRIQGRGKEGVGRLLYFCFCPLQTPTINNCRIKNPK